MGNAVSRALKLHIVTGSRADYGHLRSLLLTLKADPAFNFSLIVTGSHLSERLGNSVKEIESDRFPIAAKVGVPLDDDSVSGIAGALGSVISQTAEVLKGEPADAVVVYGDRWEMFGAAAAATLCTIPLVHIGGGEVTEGAYDESFRHSMTKMSHLHFVTHEDALCRVLQLGENPAHVFNTGSLAIDSIKNTALLSREELQRQTGFTLQKQNLLVTYHPTTLENDVLAEITTFLKALALLPKEFGILFTQPSLDTGSLQMIPLIETFVAKRPHTKLVSSLGYQRYISAISLCDVVVGNSSSGLFEVPSFGKATVNVGDRQRGRLKAASVIDVPVVAEKITEGIQRALTSDQSRVTNPYGDGTAGKKIAEILKNSDSWRATVKKHFFMHA